MLTCHSLSKFKLPNLIFKPHLSLLHTLPPSLHKQKIHLLNLLQQECTNFNHLKQIQAQMVLSGIFSDTFAANRLLAFCALSDSPNLPYGNLILNQIENPNVFSWNLAIRGFADSSDPKQSVYLYREMLCSNGRPDNYTFTFLFKACAKNWDMRTGVVAFGQAVELGMSSDVFVINAAIHCFASCGALDGARKLFDESCVRDLVSWNTMINAYVQRGRPREALDIFHRMMVEKVRADEVTMIGIIACCTQLQDLDLGRRIHRYIQDKDIKGTVPLTNALMDMYVKCGSLQPAQALFDGMSQRTVVSWTTMIMGYAKFGLLKDARRVFDEMPQRDVVPWNALMAGYVQCRRGKEAFSLFQEMQGSLIKPNEVTMISILSACSQLGALEMGMWIHRYIEKQKFQLDITLGTALVDMYAKCGNIKESLRIFNEMTERNTLTWTSIICGLSGHGHGKDAIKHFKRMIEIGLEPDEVTFLGVLSACCHAGLVDDGRVFFSQMSSKYRLQPKQKHYSCMVDLFGRAGLLQEAEELISSMPMEPDSVVWGALFFACRIHGNVALGERAALKLIELDPKDSGIYVLLANMYTEANMRDEADKVRMRMKEMGMEKTPGCSSIEVNGVVYEFMARDKSHSEHKEIYGCLMQMYGQMVHSRESNEENYSLPLSGFPN
ncbi:pentatricopeptide repeat-containing protein At2g22410, mitochondrial [Asparagus officinalis]|uniref:pentatricopeptide repeat-containing protein At2g22410, mitochondrial n=1 Tax=Asparagus officinalis TaxID=4686 RepID=UPI00098E2C3A|nr:pentatricopeptide repeat-containing protein At2g22410, mitochondrial [Asparagus officinalis]